MGNVGFSLVFWSFMLVTSALFFPCALLIRVLSAPFDRRLAALHLFTCFWASLYTWCNPFWRVTCEGKEKVDPGATYVITCNHQSLVDILALFRLFTHFKWVSKAENFRIPFVGWNMTLNRYIRIERGSMKGNLKMMRDAGSALRGGSSVMIFPEGTRSADGSLGSFREGAFDLAIKTGNPVLPVVIDGTAAALPKRGFVLRGSHVIRIIVLDPIPAGASDAAILAGVTRERIRAALAQIRHEPPFNRQNDGSVA